MTAIHMPPLNLISAPDWYTLLFRYPLLTAVDKEERLDVATQMYYNQGRSGHIGATSNAQCEV